MLGRKRCEECGEFFDDESDSIYCYRHREQYTCEECGIESYTKLRVKGHFRVCEDCYEAE